MCDGKCRRRHRNPKFTLSEQKSEVRFSNDSRQLVDEYTVDGCCINSGERCDFLVNIASVNTSILVELKGSDINKAISQLNTSSRLLANCLFPKRVWIISSTRCPLTRAICIMRS